MTGAVPPNKGTSRGTSTFRSMGWSSGPYRLDCARGRRCEAAREYEPQPYAQYRMDIRRSDLEEARLADPGPPSEWLTFLGSDQILAPYA